MSEAHGGELACDGGDVAGGVRSEGLGAVEINSAQFGGDAFDGGDGKTRIHPDVGVNSGVAVAIFVRGRRERWRASPGEGVA